MANDMAINEAERMQNTPFNPITNYLSISSVLALDMSGFGTYSSYTCSIIVLKLLLLSLLRTEVANADSTDGYFMVSAARTIFSGRSYGVVVGIFESKGSCSCEVFVGGRSFNSSIEMHLTPIKPISSYRFELPELLPGDYWLTVKSLRGIKFENTTKLTWHNFKNFVKIQVPKTIYRNGELLQFRVLFHNGTMNAVNAESNAIIWIEDAKGYHIKLYRELKVIKGVFQSSLRLSLNPNLGRWRICVKNGIYVLEECVHIQVIEDEFINGEKIDFQSSTEPLKHHDEDPLEDLLNHLSRSNRVKRDKPSELETDLKEVNIFADSSTDELSNITFRTRNRFARKIANIISINHGDPVGKPEMINFQLDYKPSFVICVIVSHGLVLSSAQIFPDRTNTFTTQVQLTTKIYPFVQLFIYGMEPDSNILYVATHMIEVQRRKHEHVEIEVPSEVKPGEKLTLRIKAVPNSYLGLLIVDSRSYSDDDNNDISSNYFETIMSKLRAASPDKQLNETSTVSNLGVVTMTDAKTISTTQIKLVEQTQIDDIQQQIKPKTKINHSHPVKIKPHSVKHLIPFKRSGIPNNTCCDLPSTGTESKDIWIFDNIENTLSGWRNWTTSVPDAITTWRLSAFLMDPHVGLTLLWPKPFINIKSTKPVYLQYTVPQSVQVGELLKLPVSCFNQLENELDVTISIQQNESSFQLFDTYKTQIPYSEYMDKKLSISSNSSSSIIIHLKALKPGTLILNITAISGTLNDTLVRQLEVGLPGLLLSHEMLAFKTLGWRNMKSNFQLNLPYIPTVNGVKCFLSGNMIAANIQTLKPVNRADDGEQMISKLLSIYYLWDYVRGHTSFNVRFRLYLEDLLSDGFQSLMRIRGRDGSYSFDEPPRSNCSSTWLTAYGLQAMNYLLMTPIKLDNRLLIQNENFLLSRRLNRTQFVEKCETLHRRKLNELELSLDVLKVLQLTTRIIRIEESHSWITQQLRNNSNIHLEAKRNHDIPVWIKPDEETNGNWSEYRRHIETAARILNGQITRKKVPQFEIYEWLILRLFGDACKKDCFECFTARQAIYNYVRAPKEEQQLELNVTMWGKEADQQQLNINSKNQWQAQQVQLQAENQTLNFNVDGLGELLVRCSYEYDPKKQLVEDQNQTHSYELRVTQMKASHDSEFNFKFCMQRYKLNRQFYIGTDIELQLPSGYVLSPKSVYRLIQYRKVLQTSLENGNTKMVVRLGVLNLNIFTCMTVLTTRLYEVDNLQPGMMTACDINSMRKPQVLAYNATL